MSSHTNFNIWFDNRSLYGGDTYNTRIPEAIAQTKVFLPVLTPTVADFLNDFELKEETSLDANDETIPYFVREWLYARSVPGIRIVPVAVGGYDLRSSVHQKFEKLVVPSSIMAPSGIVINSSDVNKREEQFEKLIKSIYAQLGIDANNV